MRERPLTPDPRSHTSAFHARCEWDALHHVATSSPEGLNYVDEIFLELHLALQVHSHPQPHPAPTLALNLALALTLALQMSTPDDLVKWASMYELLFTRSRFQLWWVHPNAARAPGDDLAQPFLRTLSEKSSYAAWGRGRPALAWEIGLRRFDAAKEAVGGKSGLAGGAAAAQCPKGKGKAARARHAGRVG